MGRPARVTRGGPGAGPRGLRRARVRRDDARRHRRAPGRVAGGAAAARPSKKALFALAMESEPAGEKLCRPSSSRRSPDPTTRWRCSGGSPGCSFRSSSRRWERTSRASSRPHRRRRRGRSAFPSIPRRRHLPRPWPSRRSKSTCAGPAPPERSLCASRGPARWRSLGSLQSCVFFHRVLRISRRFPWTPTSTRSSTSGNAERSAGEEQMKRKALLILLVVILAAGAVLWASSRRAVEKSRSSSPARSRRGTSRSDRSSAAASRRSSSTRARVVAGQPIVQFETDLIDLQIEQQKARVAEAEANLVKAQRGPRDEEIARARAEAENAERERLRQKALLGPGHRRRSRRTTPPRRRRGRPPRRSGSSSAETGPRTSRPRRPRSSGRATARLPRAPARGIGRAAPAAGVIESIDLRPGDLVAANQPVARMLEPSQLWVRVFVPEPQLGRVRIGQKAALTVDTFPKREFPGKGRRDPHAGRVHAPQRADARPAHGPGLRRQGRDRPRRRS